MEAVRIQNNRHVWEAASDLGLPGIYDSYREVVGGKQRGVCGKGAVH